MSHAVTAEFREPGVGAERAGASMRRRARGLDGTIDQLSLRAALGANGSYHFHCARSPVGPA